MASLDTFIIHFFREEDTESPVNVS